MKRNPGGQPRYTLDGQPTTVERMAELAGCSVEAMSKRLTKTKLTPEQAVAAGVRLPRGKHQNWKTSPKQDRNTVSPAKTTPPTGPVIVPKGVKHTIAPAPQERFVVQATFGAINSAECRPWALAATEGKP